MVALRSAWRRRFESHPLRPGIVILRPLARRGGRVAEGAPLLREYGVKPIEGSNPSLSASPGGTGAVAVSEFSGEMAERLKARAWRARVPQKGTVGSNPTLSATQSAVAETSRPHPGTAREIPAIPRGFGRRALVYPHRRLRVPGLEVAAARVFLCGQVGRFGFAPDSPQRRLRLSRPVVRQNSSGSRSRC